MKTEWRGETFDVRDCRIDPGYIRVGDWLWFSNEEGYVRVKTIQRDCPRLEDLSKVFTMFTCENRQGTIIPIPALQGKQHVLKRNRKVVTL